MLKLLNVFYETLIKPIEKQRDILYLKVNSKNIIDYLFRNQNKKILEAYDKILLETYRIAGQMLDDELEFHEQLKINCLKINLFMTNKRIERHIKQENEE